MDGHVAIRSIFGPWNILLEIITISNYICIYFIFEKVNNARFSVLFKGKRGFSLILHKSIMNHVQLVQRLKLYSEYYLSRWTNRIIKMLMFVCLKMNAVLLTRHFWKCPVLNFLWRNIYNLFCIPCAILGLNKEIIILWQNKARSLIMQTVFILNFDNCNIF